MRAVVAAALILATAACGRTRETATCELSDPSEVATAEATSFHGIAAAPFERGAWVGWSSQTGLFVRRTTDRGVPSSAPVKVGPPCRGGIAMAAHRGGVFLACSRPHVASSESGAWLYDLTPDGDVREDIKLAEVGRDASGVAVAARGDGALVAFHDGHVGAYTVRLSEIENGKVETTVLSQPSTPAYAPSLHLLHEKWVVIFSETRFRSIAEGNTRVVGILEGGKRRTLREVNTSAPLPSLSHDGGSLVLTFRERPPREKKAELYALRLSDSLQGLGAPRRIGRANSEGTPYLVRCGETTVGVLPREYAGERYVGVHGLDDRLQNLSGGHQFYATDREFVLAATTCVEGKAVVLSAERASVTSPGVRLMGMQFSCRRS